MEKNIYEAMHHVENSHWWFQGRRMITLLLIEQHLKRGAGYEILDIGCGTGGQMKHLKVFGSVKGFDIEEKAVEYCKKSGLDAQVGSTDNIPSNDSVFDLVTAFDVLEHVDDVRALEEVLRVLRPGGKLIFTVPAYKFLWSEHDTLHHHMRRYTKRRLVQLFKGTGFKIKKVSYYNFVLFPIVFGLRKIPIINKLYSVEDSLKIPPHNINSTLQKILSSERFILRYTNIPFGVSLLGVVEKPIRNQG